MDLQNAEEHAQPRQEEVTGIGCTFCLDSNEPAVKSCVMCEASMCESHLRVHSKAPEHVLTEPGTSLKRRKCVFHKEVLKYYCTEHEMCICVSCSLAGKHRGHQVEMLDEASEKKKKKLRNVLQKLITKREETEERVRSLEELRRKAQEKASGEAKRVTALFIDIRRRLDDLEKRVQSEISRRVEQVSWSLSDVIKKLEIKKDELSKEMRLIEELCNMTDPLTVLQDSLTVLQDPDTGEPKEEGGDEDTGRHDKTQDVDVDVITGTLHAGFSDIMTYLQTVLPTTPGKKRKLYHIDQSPPSYAQDLPMSGTENGGNDIMVRTEDVGGEVMAAGEEWIFEQDPEDILLDINTAANTIGISNDLKTATRENINQGRSETEERFQNHQVISREGFSSGRHYWDVQMINSGLWMVGVCYPSIDRKGNQSYIGDNNKSWCLWGGLWCNDDNSLRHHSKKFSLQHTITSDRVRIYLDYEAGQLSFYELCVPIRHLHTFTATFSEPLHAALYVFHGSVKILGGAVAGTSRST